jgi:hypothetical protein
MTFIDMEQESTPRRVSWMGCRCFLFSRGECNELGALAAALVPRVSRELQYVAFARRTQHTSSFRLW